MTAADILREAADLIGKPACWTQGAYARDGLGREKRPLSSSAVCWCMHGAVRVVADRHSSQQPWYDFTPYRRAMRTLALACKPDDAGDTPFPTNEWVHDYNDAPGRTAKDCVKKLLEAAEMAAKQEGAPT